MHAQAVMSVNNKARAPVSKRNQQPHADPAAAVRFDRNSAFHFLDGGRYLMAQLLLHALRLSR